MICKWCGTTIDPKTTSCSGCGRPVPASTDCGGFFNVVHMAQSGTAQAETTPQQQSTIRQQASPDSTPHKKGKPRIPGILLLIVPILLAGILAILLLGMNKHFDALEQQHEELKTAAEGLEEQAGAIRESIAGINHPGFPSKTDLPEPENEAEPKLNPETAELSFRFRTDSNEIAIGAKDYDGELLASHDKAENVLQWYGALGTEPEVKMWTASLRASSTGFAPPAEPEDPEEPTEPEADAETSLTLRFALSEQYRERMIPEATVWEYRRDMTADWESLEASEDIRIDETDGESTVSFSANWMENELSEAAEVRCTVTWRSQEGGILKLELSGALRPLLIEQTRH